MKDVQKEAGKCKS